MNGIRKKRFCLGLILSIVGISIGGIFKLLIGVNLSWISMTITIISMLLMVDSRKVLSLKYRKPSMTMWVIMLYSFLTLAIGMISGYTFLGNVYSIVYQIVYFIQILIIWDNVENFDSDIFLNMFFWIAGLSNLMMFFVLAQNFLTTGNLSFTYLLSATENTSGVSRATVGFIGFFGVIASAIYKAEKKKYLIFKYIFLTVSIIVVMLATRRSVFLALVLSVLVIMKDKASVDKYVMTRTQFLSGMMIIVVILVIIGGITNSSGIISQIFGSASKSLVSGLQTYLGNGNDMAAKMRRDLLDTIPYQYLNNSSLGQFIFGRGYMTQWLDVPYLQAFWDFGLVGGISYFVLNGVLPIIYIFKRTESKAVLFAKCYMCLRLMENFANGAPYGRFLPFVLLMVTAEIERREKAYRENQTV